MSWAFIGAAAIGVGGSLLADKNKPKFRQPQLPTLNDLTEEARDVFRQNQSQFLGQQVEAQKAQFGDFFDIQAQTVASGKSLIEKLTTGDLERRLATESIRGAQATRGLSLSPAAAIQEGLAVSEAQQRSEFAALGLGQELSRFSATTPLQLQQIDFSQLLSTGGQLSLAEAGFSSEAQISNINIQRDQDATNLALLGNLLGRVDTTGGGGTTTTQGDADFEPDSDF